MGTELPASTLREKPAAQWVALLIDFQGKRFLSLRQQHRIQAASAAQALTRQEGFDVLLLLNQEGSIRHRVESILNWTHKKPSPVHQPGYAPVSQAPSWDGTIRAGLSKECLAWELRGGGVEGGRKFHLVTLDDQAPAQCSFKKSLAALVWMQRIMELFKISTCKDLRSGKPGQKHQPTQAITWDSCYTADLHPRNCGPPDSAKPNGVLPGWRYLLATHGTPWRSHLPRRSPTCFSFLVL